MGMKKKSCLTQFSLLHIKCSIISENLRPSVSNLTVSCTDFFLFNFEESRTWHIRKSKYSLQFNCFSKLVWHNDPFFQYVCMSNCLYVITSHLSSISISLLFILAVFKESIKVVRALSLHVLFPQKNLDNLLYPCHYWRYGLQIEIC